MKTTLALILTILALMPLDEIRAAEISISGTRFLLDGKLFPYTGVSFFNAIYNTNFNASSQARITWLKKFQSYGMFHTGYGTPACPPTGVPDPEFSPYHRQVFEFLKLRDKYAK